MAQVGIAELLEAGVHFGHQTRRWNPKMRRFIHGERGGIYIIDLLKTADLLAQAQDFASQIAHRRRRRAVRRAPSKQVVTRSSTKVASAAACRS